MRPPVTTGVAIDASKDATRRPFFRRSMVTIQAARGEQRVQLETPRRHETDGALG
jgi:hypothetical protein